MKSLLLQNAHTSLKLVWHRASVCRNAFRRVHQARNEVQSLVHMPVPFLSSTQTHELQLDKVHPYYPFHIFLLLQSLTNLENSLSSGMFLSINLFQVMSMWDGLIPTQSLLVLPFPRWKACVITCPLYSLLGWGYCLMWSSPSWGSFWSCQSGLLFFYVDSTDILNSSDREDISAVELEAILVTVQPKKPIRP